MLNVIYINVRVEKKQAEAKNTKTTIEEETGARFPQNTLLLPAVFATKGVHDLRGIIHCELSLFAATKHFWPCTVNV